MVRQFYFYPPALLSLRVSAMLALVILQWIDPCWPAGWLLAEPMLIDFKVPSTASTAVQFMHQWPLCEQMAESSHASVFIIALNQKRAATSRDRSPSQRYCSFSTSSINRSHSKWGNSNLGCLHREEITVILYTVGAAWLYFICL